MATSGASTRALWRLAAPVALGRLGVVGMGVVDSVRGASPRDAVASAIRGD